MMRSVFVLLAVVLAVAPGISAQESKVAHEKPALFSSLGYDAAMQQSVSEKKLMILDCMTSWCAPCKAMDRTTWVEKGLVDWVGAHAVAIQLDMDHEAGLKTDLKITAFPTIVVFKDGVEVERVVGSRDAEFMKTWLGGLAEGKSRKAATKDRYLAAKKNPALSPVERAEIFEALVETRLFDEARAEAAPLLADSFTWTEKIKAPIHYELLSAFADLAKQDERALAAMAKEIDAIAPGTRPDLFVDWFTLNAWIGRHEVILAWAKKAAETDEGRKLLVAHGAQGLFSMLIDAGDWRTAGFTIGNAVDRVKTAADWRAQQKNGMMPAMRAVRSKPGRKLTMDEILDRQAEDEAANVHAALLAADREADAWKAADTILEFRPDSARARTALVARALSAKKYDATRHAKLLAEAVEN